MTKRQKQQIKITIQQLQNHKICHLIPHFIFLLAAVIYSAYSSSQQGKSHVLIWGHTCWSLLVH